VMFSAQHAAPPVAAAVVDGAGVRRHPVSPAP
jgi:hypothetical protein